jgi:hypothetical protein
MRLSGGLSNITLQYDGDLRVTGICSFLGAEFFPNQIDSSFIAAFDHFALLLASIQPEVKMECDWTC